MSETKTGALWVRELRRRWPWTRPEQTPRELYDPWDRRVVWPARRVAWERRIGSHVVTQWEDVMLADDVVREHAPWWRPEAA